MKILVMADLTCFHYNIHFIGWVKIFCHICRFLHRNAIVTDEFLRDLDPSQINDIVSVMFPMDYDKGAQFVKENEPGNFVYVMESGKALASRSEKVLFKIFAGKLFGEPQAMLYNSPRWVLFGLQYWLLYDKVSDQPWISVPHCPQKSDCLKDASNLDSSVPKGGWDP